MLKWGLRLLAIFAVLLGIFMVVQDVPHLAVYILFYALIFNGLLGFNLLLAGLVQRFVTPKHPYLLFTGTVVIVWFGLCCYGYYDMTHDTSSSFPGLLGLLIIGLSTIFHFVFIAGAGISYLAFSRKKMAHDSDKDSLFRN